jgi:pseudouridine-5'-phosphate glycosidase
MRVTCSKAVRSALQKKFPVVALESTLITHGLPAPTNLEVARKLEAVVKAEGAVPATIAILDGEILAGLSEQQLEALAHAENVRKCSRRDLPLVVARRENGATTVAATMCIAHAAGIQVFATGGIGGVHRGHPHDVSADLEELGRTPITVVCAGAKAILDLPLTLEVLETKGVPVIGYQTDTLPAFYCVSSGLPVDVRCDDVTSVADLVKARDQLALSAGMLVTVPVPSGDALDETMANQAIEQALQEADMAGFSGKEVTPFLLARVSEVTGQESQKANISLLENNTRVAAQLAKALSS